MGDRRGTAIVGARVFDGDRVVDDATVVVRDDRIETITGPGGAVPPDVEVVAGRGGTLLPGLIDAHVHADVDSLRMALRFGVTTVLEMQGHWTDRRRAEVAESDDLADIRSAGFSLTTPDGHPTQFFPEREVFPGTGDANDDGVVYLAPFAQSVPDAVAIVDNLVQTGSDYIKIMIEDGMVMDQPGMVALDAKIVVAAVEAAHGHGKLAIAHALTAEATHLAVSAGVDGLSHLFVDRAATPDDVARVHDSGAFVTACLVLDSSVLGRTDDAFNADPRLAASLPPAELARLRTAFDHFPQGRWDDVTTSLASLHLAGVDLLVGTDATSASLGLVPGASVHHELRLLTEAGLSPLEALRAATSVTADRFGLADRGRIRSGLRADLLLVDGDPTAHVEDTLSVRRVWRRGVVQP